VILLNFKSDFITKILRLPEKNLYGMQKTITVYSHLVVIVDFEAVLIANDWQAIFKYLHNRKIGVQQNTREANVTIFHKAKKIITVSESWSTRRYNFLK
jgi:hypothetical protein